MGKGKNRGIKKVDPEILTPEERIEEKRVITTATKFSGPLPHPEIMRQYNEIHPDFADRIIAGWENETNHRHKLEEQAIASEIKTEQAISGDVKRGQWLAFFLSIGFLCVGGFLTYNDKQIAGVIFGSSGFLGIVVAFLNTAFKSRDNNHKNGNNQENPDDKDPE